MILFVEHITTYHYESPVRLVVQSQRLKPSPNAGQSIRHWEVTASDGRAGGGWRDGAGDWVQGWTARGPLDSLTVTVRGEVETSDTARILRGHRERINPMVYLRDTPSTRADVALSDIARAADAEARAEGPLALAHRLAAEVAAAIKWTPGTTLAHTTAAEALAQGEGVCQDHAHALIAMARVCDMPARYVTGYLFADPEDGPQEAAHAWAEIWVEGLGWVGFDPANACCPDDRYIRLGSGLDAANASPIRGIAHGNGAESLEVTVHVAEASGQHQSQQ
jgi:transglutaminase-like putative cysteine protease